MAFLRLVIDTKSWVDTTRCILTAIHCGIPLSTSVTVPSNVNTTTVAAEVPMPLSTTLINSNECRPLLITRDGFIFNALAICRYLIHLNDSNTPAITSKASETQDAAFLPKAANGDALWANIHWVNWILFEFDGACNGPNEEPVVKCLNVLESHLTEAMKLSNSAMKFVGPSDFITLADIFLWSSLSRSRFGRVFTYWPAVSKYLAFVDEHPVVRALSNLYPSFIAPTTPSKFFSWQHAASHTVSPEVVKEAEKRPVSKDKYYITTAISYANGLPHVGHAYENIITDFIARAHRIYNHDVYFLTGTDEHGIKIANTANRLGIKPIELCDQICTEFKKLNNKLSISNNAFMRTSEEKHKDGCKWLWNVVKSKGDIYLSTYKGWYSEREETFLSDADAKALNYVDEATGLPLMWMEEESYFFRMSKYQDRLVQHIHDNPAFIMPESRRNEILSRLSEPLLDLSCSRTNFSWGVPVPDDPKHVMYVWFDALANYITALTYPTGELARYWPADAHMIGKDIAWFHTVIWPCILLSAGIPLPKSVLVHGFISAADGRKMSKSIGNVVDPNAVLSEFPSDTLRLFLIKEAKFGGDFRFDMDAFIDLHNSSLADSLGNLVHRATSLCKRFCDGLVPEERPPDEKVPFDYAQVVGAVEVLLSHYRLDEVAELVMSACHSTNKYVTELSPWAVTDAIQRRRIVRGILEAIYVLAHLFEPILPVAAQEIFNRLNTPASTLPHLSCWFNNLKPGTPITIGEVLFRKAPLRIATHIIQKFEIRIGSILNILPHETNKQFGYLKVGIFNVDAKDKSPECRICLAPIQQLIGNGESLIGQKVPVVCNVVHTANSKAPLNSDSAAKGEKGFCFVFSVGDKCALATIREPNATKELEVGSLISAGEWLPVLKSRDLPTPQEWHSLKFVAKGHKLHWEDSLLSTRGENVAEVVLPEAASDGPLLIWQPRK